jgi:hypothetical protein
MRCFRVCYSLTGEIVTLDHRWVYNPNEAAVDEMVYEKEVVGEDAFSL